MNVPFKRACLIVALLGVLLVTAGCGKYWQYRKDDLLETFDLGITISDDWQWEFYHSIESFVTFGYADYDATFYGWGNGKVGKMPFYLHAWGAGVIGKERFGWENYDKDDWDTLYTQTIGVVGTPIGFFTGNSNPHYVPT